MFWHIPPRTIFQTQEYSSFFLYLIHASSSVVYYWIYRQYWQYLKDELVYPRQSVSVQGIQGNE